MCDLKLSSLCVIIRLADIIKYYLMNNTLENLLIKYPFYCAMVSYGFCGVALLLSTPISVSKKIPIFFRLFGVTPCNDMLGHCSKMA